MDDIEISSHLTDVLEYGGRIYEQDQDHFQCSDIEKGGVWKGIGSFLLPCSASIHHPSFCCDSATFLIMRCQALNVLAMNSKEPSLLLSISLLTDPVHYSAPFTVAGSAVVETPQLRLCLLFVQAPSRYP